MKPCTGSSATGGGLLVSTRQNIRPAEGEEATWGSSPFSVYSQRHGFPADASMSGGLSLAVRKDNRDSQIDARRDIYLNGTYQAFFKGFLGGDSSWQDIDVDARTYRSLDTVSISPSRKPSRSKSSPSPVLPSLHGNSTIMAPPRRGSR